jgi:hypothetical protein
VLRRTAALGWRDEHVHELADDAAIVRYLRSDRAAIDAHGLPWEGGLPDGAAAPALLVPMFSRGRLHGFIVYGAHIEGTTLDPTEIGLLADFGARAAVAFDHLAYDALEQRLGAALRGATG